MSRKTKAIIIGAGPAGLTAAYKLLKTTDIHPVIIEETDSIGGISKTIDYKGNRMDIGGHRFFSKNQQVVDMWTELMPLQGEPAKDDRMLGRSVPLKKGGPDPEKTDRVMLIRNRVSRILYLRKFFDYPLSIKPATFINMGFKRTVKAGLGYIRSAISKRDEHSLKDFMINRFGEPLYEMFFEDYTEKVWGRNPGVIDASWGEQRIKGLSLSKAVLSVLKKPFVNKNNTKNVETSLIKTFYYPKKGPGQLWETLAKEIEKLGGEIHLNTKAVGFNVKNGVIESITAEKDGVKENIEGDIFLSSMPIKDLVRALGSGVPQDVKQIAENLPYRDFITVGLLLKKLKLKNETNLKTVSNIVPDCWIYVQERDVKIGRIQIFNNWSPYMVKDLENTVWIGLEYFCNEGDSMWNMSDSEFIDFAVGELCKMDIIDKDDVLDATRIKVKKAYPAYFDSYKDIGRVREYLDTIDNLYCIGRNGQHRYNNMDHSMLTAMEAVECIRTGSKDKSRVWNVNTEKEYHEEK